MRDAWRHTGFMGAEFIRRVSSKRIKLAHRIDGKVFVHAGLTSEFQNLYKDSRETSGYDPLDLLNVDFDVQLQELQVEDMSRTLKSNFLLHGDRSPAYTRQCYDKDACAEVVSALDHVGGDYLVIGHCPYPDQVLKACDGRFV